MSEKRKQEKMKAEMAAKLDDLLKIQGTDGNWNYNEYMRGLYNGLEMAKAMLEGREPEFKSFVSGSEGQSGQ